MSKGNIQHTDDIFKEKFEGFNIEPSPEVWSNIEGSMARRKRNKLIIISTIGIAASLLLLLIPNWLFDKSSFDDRNTLYTGIQKDSTLEEYKTTKADTAIIAKKKDTPSIFNKEEKTISLPLKRTTTKKSNKQKTETRTIIIPINSVNDKELLALNNEIIFPSGLKENKDIERIRRNIYLLNRSKEKIIAKPKIQLNFGQSRSAKISSNENINFRTNIVQSEFSDQKKSPIHVTKSSVKIKNDFGINLEIPIKNRISLLTGIRYLAFTDDKDKINSNDAALGPIKDINTIMENASFKFVKEIKQEFSNIEIPVNLKYYIINKKLSVFVTGGVGINFMIYNNADIILSDDSKHQSETEDLTRISYSGLIGVGISYNINKSIYLSIEPHYRHYFNSLSKNDRISIKPNITNVSFGLGFKF